MASSMILYLHIIIYFGSLKAKLFKLFLILFKMKNKLNLWLNLQKEKDSLKNDPLEKLPLEKEELGSPPVLKRQDAMSHQLKR